jgi:VWFA-related protein
MRLQLSLLPLLLLPGAAAFAAKPPAAAPPSFGEAVEVNLVNVDVYATDKSGNRVTDLKRGDFQVFEDGKPVEITHFATVEGGIDTSAPGSSAASAPEDVWNLVVFVDNFHLNPVSRARAVRQLREFAGREILPTDRVMVATQDFSLNVRLPFTGDQADLARTLGELDHLSVHGPEIEQQRKQAFDLMMSIQQQSHGRPQPLSCPLDIATPAHSFAASRRGEVLRAIDGLRTMVNSLSGVPGRKAVLHVSDGLPLKPGQELFEFLLALCGSSNDGLMEAGGESLARNGGQGARRRAPAVESPIGQSMPSFEEESYQADSQAPLDAESYSVVKELQALAAHANAQRVTIYTLQASGLQAPYASSASFGPQDRLFQFPAIGASLRMNNRDSLQLLADDTGGRSILDTNDFLPDLARLRQDFESFYSLGFAPVHNGAGREHRIEVKVKRAGVRLRYRQSYRDKTAVEKIVDRTLAALLYGFEDNPLGITVEVGEQTPAASGNVRVPIQLKIPLFKLAILNHEAAGIFEGNLRLFVATRTPDGNGSPLRQVPVPIRIPRKQVLNAMGQFYLYTLTLELKPGAQQVAVAVRDEIAATTSYLSRAITVGTAAAAVTNP